MYGYFSIWNYYLMEVLHLHFQSIMHLKLIDTANELMNQFYPVVNKFFVTGITVQECKSPPRTKLGMTASVSDEKSLATHRPNWSFWTGEMGVANNANLANLLISFVHKRYTEVCLRCFPSQAMRACLHAYYYDISWLLNALTSKMTCFFLAYNIRPKFNWTFGTHLTGLLIPSPLAKCHNLTFGPSLCVTEGMHTNRWRHVGSVEWQSNYSCAAVM